MILRAKVKVTRTFSTKKLDNLAMLRARTLKQKGCWSSPVDDTEGKGHGQGHHDLKYEKAYNSAVLEARTLVLRCDVGLDQ